jgi:Deoxyribodipyrimidine photolyase
LPLIEATKNELPLIPLYVIEPNYWKQDFSSRRHWYFISDCLQELREELEYLGQPLIVRKNEVIDVLNEILQKF